LLKLYSVLLLQIPSILQKYNNFNLLVEAIFCAIFVQFLLATDQLIFQSSC